jgi:hypothetical protein
VRDSRVLRPNRRYAYDRLGRLVITVAGLAADSFITTMAQFFVDRPRFLALKDLRTEEGIAGIVLRSRRRA